MSNKFTHGKRVYKPKVCSSKPAPKTDYQYLFIVGGAIGVCF